MQRFGTKCYCVGTHVCDVTGFIQTLGDAHDFACCDAQLVAAFLLQSTRHKRSLWRLAVWLFFYAAHFESGAL